MKHQELRNQIFPVLFKGERIHWGPDTTGDAVPGSMVLSMKAAVPSLYAIINSGGKQIKRHPIFGLVKRQKITTSHLTPQL